MSTTETPRSPRFVRPALGPRRGDRRGRLRGHERGRARDRGRHRPPARAGGGAELLRFFYRSNGRIIRGPLTLRADERAGLRAALAGARRAAQAAAGAGRVRRSGERVRRGAGERDAGPCRIVRPSVEPSSASTACSGCGIRPSTLPGRVRDGRDVVARAVRVLDVAQQHLAAVPRPPPTTSSGAVHAPSWCLIGIRSRSPATRSGSHGESGCSTRRSTSRATKRPPWFGRSTPGSSPASHSTWKPLQMPSTGARRPRAGARRPSPARAGRSRPGAGSRRTRSRRARARRRAAGGFGVAVPDAHGLGADQLERAHRVAVVAGAGERDHADPASRQHHLEALDQVVRERLLGGLRWRPGAPRPDRRSRARDRTPCRRARSRPAARGPRGCSRSRAPAGRGCPASAGRARSRAFDSLLFEIGGERTAGEQLVRLAVARRDALGDLVGQRRRRAASCPTAAPRASRARTACRSSAGSRPAARRRRARSARSRASCTSSASTISPSASSPNSNLVSASDDAAGRARAPRRARTRRAPRRRRGRRHRRRTARAPARP